MVDDAIDYAEDNKGWVAAGAAAVVLWFARKPILGWMQTCSTARARNPARLTAVQPTPNSTGETQ